MVRCAVFERREHREAFPCIGNDRRHDETDGRTNASHPSKPPSSRRELTPVMQRRECSVSRTSVNERGCRERQCGGWKGAANFRRTVSSRPIPLDGSRKKSPAGFGHDRASRLTVNRRTGAAGVLRSVLQLEQRARNRQELVGIGDEIRQNVGANGERTLELSVAILRAAGTHRHCTCAPQSVRKAEAARR